MHMDQVEREEQRSAESFLPRQLTVDGDGVFLERQKERECEGESERCLVWNRERGVEMDRKRKKDRGTEKQTYKEREKEKNE